jgi:hypothetical protein
MNSADEAGEDDDDDIEHIDAKDAYELYITTHELQTWMVQVTQKLGMVVFASGHAVLEAYKMELEQLVKAIEARMFEPASESESYELTTMHDNLVKLVYFVNSKL